MKVFQDCTVESGQASAVATAVVPPSRWMISRAVMPERNSENRNSRQAPLADNVIAPENALVHLTRVLTTAELLARLTERGIPRTEIAKAIDVHPSRVTEMFKGDRRINLDEAVKLVAAFDLESLPDQKVPPLPAPIASLIVQHISRQLGHPLEEESPQLQVLSEDLRAFAEYVSDPQVRERIDLAMAFFQAMRLRNPSPGEAAQQGTDSLSAK